VALLGQERSPQPSGKKHNSGFGLSPIAVTKSYKIKLKKTNIRMSRNKNWSNYQAKSQLISLLQKNYFQ